MKMSTTSKWILAISAGLIVLVFVGLVVQIPMGSNASEMRAKIEKSLAIGASREQVLQFVSSEGMEQSSYLERERMINAIKRGVARGLFTETSVYVRFYFDEKGALQRYIVEEVFTGL